MLPERGGGYLPKRQLGPSYDAVVELFPDVLYFEHGANESDDRSLQRGQHSRDGVAHKCLRHVRRGTALRHGALLSARLGRSKAREERMLIHSCRGSTRPMAGTLCPKPDLIFRHSSYGATNSCSDGQCAHAGASRCATNTTVRATGKATHTVSRGRDPEISDAPSPTRFKPSVPWVGCKDCHASSPQRNKRSCHGWL